MQHCPLIRIQTSWTNYIFFPSLLPIPRDARDSARICFKLYPIFLSLPLSPLAPFLPGHFIELSKKRSTSIHNFKTDLLVESWSETSGNRNSYYRSFSPHPTPFPSAYITPCERDKEFCRILPFLSVVNLNAVDWNSVFDWTSWHFNDPHGIYFSSERLSARERSWISRENNGVSTLILTLLTKRILIFMIFW